MRISTRVGAGVLASAACLLAACSGMDPSDLEASEHELGAFQAMQPTRAVDVSQGASCVETIRPTGLECPGMSSLEVSAISASLQSRLTGLSSPLRVTVLRTGNSLIARIDSENPHAFAGLFGTTSLMTPVQRDGTFDVTVPLAERGFGAEGGMGGFPGGAGHVGPMGGGPMLGGQPGLGFQPGFQTTGAPGFGGCQPIAPPACGLGFAQAMRPTQNAFGVIVHLHGKVDLADVQFARNQATDTEVAILDRDDALSMRGEIVLIPLTGQGPEAAGPQAAPGGPQAVPQPGAYGGGPQAMSQPGAFGGGPQAMSQPGAIGGGPQAMSQPGAIGGGPEIGTPGAQPPPGSQPTAGPQSCCPQMAVSQRAELGCRIPLSLCGSCGVSTGLSPEQGAIITTPNIPEQPVCPQMIIRPTMASPCCGVGVAPMSAPACPSGCQ